MYLSFLLKLLVVVFFLAMFLRRTNMVWGIGLLTVTTALLLDTMRGAFGEEALAAQLGFFYYVIVGALLGGGAIFLFGILRPVISGRATQPATFSPGEADRGSNPQPANQPRDAELADRIRRELSPEDVFDVIFDLEMNENDILIPQQPVSAAVDNLVATAERSGKHDELKLAVERSQTPISTSDLPRREKLNSQSPPTVLRHFLLANYTEDSLRDLAGELSLDWEQLGREKRSLARNMLLYLSRRNRTEELVAAMTNRQSAER